MSLSREQRTGVLIAIGIVLLVLVGLAVRLAGEAAALHYTLQFEDAKGLVAGDKVVLNGLVIGEVKRVELSPSATGVLVRVKIEPQYTDNVRSDSTAIITGIAFPNVSGQMVVEILNPENVKLVPAMRDDTIVDGVDGKVDKKIWQMKQKLGDVPEKVGEAKDALLEKGGHLREKASDLSKAALENSKEIAHELGELKDDPRVRQALAALADFLREMKERGWQGVHQLKEKWPTILENIGPVLEELQRVGAESVIEKIRGVVRDVERTLELYERLFVENERQQNAPSNATESTSPTSVR